MRDLAVVIAVGWFWLLFYGVGPLDSGSQLMVGGGRSPSDPFCRRCGVSVWFGGARRPR